MDRYPVVSAEAGFLSTQLRAEVTELGEPRLAPVKKGRSSCSSRTNRNWRRGERYPETGRDRAFPDRVGSGEDERSLAGWVRRVFEGVDAVLVLHSSRSARPFLAILGD